MSYLSERVINMDKRLSSKDQKMLLNALDKAKVAAAQMRLKEEAKRWEDIEAPFTLANGLARLTKYDLSTIRSNWNIRGASSLKKQELIAVMEQHVSAALSNLFFQLDETGYGIMKKIADRGGHGFLPLENHQIDFFKDRGMLFPGTYEGRRILFIPQEVLAVFRAHDAKPLREAVKKNTEWVKLTQGLLSSYGALSFDELKRLLKQHAGVIEEPTRYLMALSEAESFYREMRIDQDGLIHHRVSDANKVKQEQESRPDLPFYPFTKEQLLRAGEPGFIDRHPSYLAFVIFITSTYSLPRDEADSYVEECVYMVQNGETPGSILKNLQLGFQIDELQLVQRFMNHIVMLSNHTKQWYLKGYSPDEMSSARSGPSRPGLAASADIIDFATRRKVGRNDPCSCGSGKKFKKCCGG